MKKLFTIVCLMALSLMAFAQEEEELSPEELQEFEELIRQTSDSLDATMDYQYGSILLGGDIATLKVPEGFKFVNREKAKYVLTDVWGNPEDESTLGLIFPEDSNPFFMSYAIEVSYVEDGYIEDDDAADINYYELLDQMKEDSDAENEQRASMGYPMVELIGWASSPYYDSKTKKLYWAKELKFEESEINTLNYNIRILGRKGYLMLNYIADIDQLDLINANIDPVLNSVEFNEGYRYEDFDSSIDDVAAYGIGGLIAGKILAKAGFFAVLLKFWKLILIGIAGIGAGVRRFLKGKRAHEETTKPEAT
ncbi:DUF2167 domain-containing protein [Roseivirga sp.]|uniref:DUF2167 domain-containing protein n=1 Tax=Roseivirga sp. TaxID=1964215 RepID=UPI003B521ABD